MLRREPLLQFCRALPHATEDVKWGADLCFSVGGKMFAVFGMEGATFSCKATEEAFHALTAGSAGAIVPAPYVARYFWIAVKDPKALSSAQAQALIRDSYGMVFDALPARLRASLTGAPVDEARAKTAAPARAAKKTNKTSTAKARR